MGEAKTRGNTPEDRRRLSRHREGVALGNELADLAVRYLQDADADTHFEDATIIRGAILQFTGCMLAALARNMGDASLARDLLDDICKTLPLGIAGFETAAQMGRDEQAKH